MSKNDIKSYSSNNDAGAKNRLTLKQQRFVDSYIRNGGDGASSKSCEYVTSLVLNTDRKNFMVKYYSTFSFNNQIDIKGKIKSN